MTDVLTPTGRIVWGHPMTRKAKTDNKGAPKLDKTLQPMFEYSFGLAIPKGVEAHWNQTEWGSKIWAEGVAGFPGGEYNWPSFAWKVTDGDSMVPNRKGKIPAQQEGYKGCWVLSCSVPSPIRCFYSGKYEPHQVMQNPAEIKCGDYVRVFLSCKGNASTESQGVYINPSMVSLDAVGEAIVSNQVDAATAFGAGTVYTPPVGAPTPQAAYQAPAPQSTPVAPVVVTPNAGFMAPPPPPSVSTPSAPVVRMVMYQGQAMKYDDLIAGGWTDAMILQHTTPVA